ncbi:MAG: hypothetical protein ACRD4B_08465, partial [Acidobacteriota bacterium]
MSYAWWFYSFSPEKFQAIFGQATDEQQKQLIDSVTWNGRDDPVAVNMVRNITRNGISYNDLSPKESSVLDEIVKLSMTPEGIADLLEVEPESPEGLHPSVITELLQRVEEKNAQSILCLFLRGRRVGAIETSDCEYIVLGSTEVLQ